MSIKIQNTSDVHTAGVKFLVYGEAGAGKTTLIRTLPNPIILSAEAGLLSLRGSNIPFIEIANMEDMGEAYTYLTTDPEGMKFESIALDSISEIAEVILSAEKKKTTDARQAYGKLQEQIGDLVRAFRDISNRNVYFSAKMEKLITDDGVLRAASLPGKKTSEALPYFFEEVLALRINRNEDGTVERMLQTSPDGIWSAKDRSGCLDTWELPDLGAIIKKIKGATNVK